MAKAQRPHIAILPSPGMGHLIPLVEFAKRLIHQHGFTVTFVIPTDGSPSKALKSTLDSLPTFIDSVFLPPVDLSDLPPDSKIETRISLTVSRSLSSLHDAFVSMVAGTKLVGLVVDMFGTDAFDVANEFNVPSYTYFPSTAMMLLFFLYLQELDRTVSFEYKNMVEPVRLPGCIPIHRNELVDPTQDRKDDAYKWLLHHANRFRSVKRDNGKQFPELGKWTDKGLASETIRLHQVARYSTGRFGFVCLLRQRWDPFTTPNDTIANATYFNVDTQKDDDPFMFLPKGFVERTKGRRLVVVSWVPQARVLNHGSTGGFLTHCGWNSVLESVDVVNGIPLIAWPLYAEQKMNALMLSEDAKVALRPKPNKNGLICRDEIAKVVKCLMGSEEGKSVRNRMLELKEAAKRVLCENGSSTIALSEVADSINHALLSTN
ncbi:hypothetical protein CXB51_021098 [Gossypium anomalum]|uniref:Glycosyltransferase n=1 Tax=Gossypium anomalum TaxID=47600 RepID=A0A8J5YA66_9ROSI|nr:hypothetical protein CXB51_021098 [Gossypium anomalum]